MSYESNLRGYTVIDKSNVRDFQLQAKRRTTGDKPAYTGRDYRLHPFGRVDYAKPFALPVIPRSEWPERIKDIEKQKARLSDLIRAAKLPCLDQQQTNYCWMNGVIHAVIFARLVAGLPFVALSSASVAAKIKNYQNVGGWGGEAIEGIRKYGIVPEELWPNAAIERRFDTAEAREAAKLYNIVEFEEIRPQSFDEVMTCLLLGFPVPIGHSWWGHLVCHCDPIMRGRGEFGTRFRNSWGIDWEDEGFGLCDEEHATPDEANVVRVATTGAQAA